MMRAIAQKAGMLTSSAAGDLGRVATLDAARPRIKLWLKDHAAELVRNTVGTSKDAVRTIIQAGVDMGRHPRRLALDVRGVVGLTDPQAIAVARRREYLLGQDMPAERVHAGCTLVVLHVDIRETRVRLIYVTSEGERR